MSNKVQIVERKDPTLQSKASTLNIKNLFNDVLNETKGFKYLITVKVLIKKNISTMEKLNLDRLILIH